MDSKFIILLVKAVLQTLFLLTIHVDKIFGYIYQYAVAECFVFASSRKYDS
jgi:hypothetical protein